MESAFRTRVDRAFGFLLGSNMHHQAGAESESTAGEAENSTVTPEFWSVSERAISTERFAGTGDEDSGDDSDDNTAADYQRFVRLERRGRRRRREDLTADEPEEEGNEDESRERKRRRERGFEEDVAVDRTEEDEDEEVREMRRMIGKDCTLDFEEEEDEYDKVAVGREGAGDRMFMKEIRGSCLDTFHLPPGHGGAIGTFRRDSRANHAAAAARLKEDKEAEAKYKFTSSNGNRESSPAQLPSVSSTITCLTQNLDEKGISKDSTDQVVRKEEKPSEVYSAPSRQLESPNEKADSLEEGRSSGRVGQLGMGAGTQGSNLGKEDGDSSATAEEIMMKKRKKARTVRFDVADSPSEKRRENEAETPTEEKNVHKVSNYHRVTSNVPDHVRNPSKYTHYTLEWSDDEDDSKSNLLAFQSFKSLTQEPEKGDVRSLPELPHSIIFTPKFGGTALKVDGSAVEKRKKDSSFVPVLPSVSFVEAVVEEDVNVNEDSLSRDGLTEGKTGRVFRKRARSTLEDDVDSERIDSFSS